MTVALLWVCFALVNAAAFAAFAFDKVAAQNGWRRISEASLLLLALVGGSLGALIGQRVARHKTRKQPFRSYLIAIAVVHITVALLLLIPGLGATLLSAIKGAFGQ